MFGSQDYCVPTNQPFNCHNRTFFYQELYVSEKEHSKDLQTVLAGNQGIVNSFVRRGKEPCLSRLDVVGPADVHVRNGSLMSCNFVDQALVFRSHPTLQQK